MRKLTHEEISAARIPPERAKMAPRHPILAVLDNVRSLYNVGSMFRTADGAWIRELLLSGYTPHPPRREIEKTALGTTATIPWRHYRDPLEVIAIVRSQGARLCVLEHTTSSVSYDRLSKKEFPLCLVVGNELTGVSPEYITAADLAIEIPMYGTKQSLNAAVAFGIALFELVRVWNSA
jgi:23S rRNA (guanosine2251-2'-O)-methyltransferase